MRYSQLTKNLVIEPSPVRMASRPASSEALQDLIDILKQNYVSDCPHCAGTGTTLHNRACKPCMGQGKLKG